MILRDHQQIHSHLWFNICARAFDDINGEEKKALSTVCGESIVSIFEYK